MIPPEIVELSQTVREVLAEHGPLTTAGVGVYLQDRQPEDLAAACIRTGRHYLGWEQDSGYYEQMQERLKTETYRKKAITILGCRQTPCPIPAAHLTASNVYLFPHLNRAKRASRKQITADTVSYPAENLDKRSPTGYNVIT